VESSQRLADGLARPLASGSDDGQQIRQLPLFLAIDGIEPGIDLRQGVVPDVLPGMAMGDQALAGIGPAN
jgi:hypothetical protein